MPKRKATRSVPPRKKSLPARFLQSVEEAVLSEGPPKKSTPKKSQARHGQRDSREHTGQHQPEDDEAAQSSHHSPIVSESVTDPLATGLPGFSITEPQRQNRVTPPQVGQVIVPLATGLPGLSHRDPVVSPLSSSTVTAPGSGPGFVPSTTGLSGFNPADTATLVATITSQVMQQLRATNTATSSSVNPRHVPPMGESSESEEEEINTNTMIAGAINGLVSGESQHVTPRDHNDFQSVSLPLGNTVPSKLKSKIWADEYIDLKMLTKEAEEEEITFTVRKSQGSSSIAMTPTGSKTSPLDNIQEWTNAMLTFAAIYTERHPVTAPAMLKYVRSVRDMSAQGGNWIYYDTQFRKQKAHYHWQWDFIHWELHFNAMSKPVPRFSAPLSAKKPSMNMGQPFHVPRGFCWGYHKTGKCANPSPCQFKHACFRCGAKHASRWCTQQKRPRDAEKFTQKSSISSKRP